MLDDSRVRDVYIRIDDYPNISLHAPIGHAFHIMHHVLEDKNKYRTILVLDDDSHLKGYISLKDLIKSVGPDYLKKTKPHFMKSQTLDGFEQDLTSLSLIWQEGFTLNLQDVLAKPVSECMTVMEDQVTLNDTIAKCLYLMFYHDILVLPVVEDDEVIGVVRMVDLFERIADNVERVWEPQK